MAFQPSGEDARVPKASTRRRKAPRRRASHRSVKTHHNLTIDDAARVTGVSKGTIRRWIKSGVLPAITDKKPFLILGGDLKDFLRARVTKGPPLDPQQFYCFGCGKGRYAALGLADYVPLSPSTGNLKALCETCGCVMNKMTSLTKLANLRGILEVTMQQASEHLIDTANLPLNDHFGK